jgi:Tfp pilus assembly protein PilV
MLNFNQKNNKAFTRALTLVLKYKEKISLYKKNINSKLVLGFTLVETLVAISIFTISVVSVIVVLGDSLKHINYAKNKVKAVYLAQEGIEFIRNKRDNYVLDPTTPSLPATKWGNFKAYLTSNTCYVLSSDLEADKGCDIKSSNLMGANSGTSADSVFTGTIIVEDVGDGSKEIKITSSIDWNQPSEPKHVEFQENLFNWVAQFEYF